MIFAQTLRVCREGKPVSTFPEHALNETEGRLGWRALSFYGPLPPKLGEASRRLICPSGCFVAPLSSPFRKNFLLSFRRKSPAYSLPSRPFGAFRHRHGRWAGMRWTRQRRARFGARRTMLMRTAKSCGPDARRWRHVAMMLRITLTTVANKLDHRGERAISRKTIAQGRPDCLRGTCMLVCVFCYVHLHTRPRVQRASGLPCAFFFERAERSLSKLGRIMSRERGVMSHRPPRGDQAIQCSVRRDDQPP
jgi:hypothetical protein